MKNKVYYTKPFLVLWFGMLISTIGTFIFLLYLSANLYLETESSLLAGGVFAAQWLPSIILFPVIVFLCSRFKVKFLLTIVELLSAVVSLLIGIIYECGWIYILLLLFIRGFLEHSMKSSRLIALKKYFTQNDIEKVSSVFNTSYYLGAALGGVIGTVIIMKFSFMFIAVIDALTFIIAAIIYYNLPNLGDLEMPSEKENNVFNIGKILEITKQNPKFVENFLILVISAGVYDGFHSIARTVIPLNIYHIGANGAAIYETVTCVSVIVASLTVYRFFCNKKRVIHPLFLVIMTNLFMVLTLVFSTLAQGLVAYFMYMFFYEILYTICLNYLVVNSPEEGFHKIAVTINSINVGAVVLFIFFGGIVIDSWGLKFSTYIFSISSMFLCLLAILVKLVLKHYLSKPRIEEIDRF